MKLSSLIPGVALRAAGLTPVGARGPRFAPEWRLVSGTR